jgi:predicted P-loop ATPase
MMTELLSPHIALYVNEVTPENMCAPVAWERLVAKLTHVVERDCHPCPGKTCRQKFGVAWSPVRIEGKRKGTNVKAVTVAVFDLDDISHADLEALKGRIKGLRYVIHSTHTHQHDGPGHNYLRLVVSLSREATPEEWPRVLAMAIEHYGIPADPACKDLSRLYFLPTRPRGTYPLVCRAGDPILTPDGLVEDTTPLGPIDVDAMLNRWALSPRATVAAKSMQPPPWVLVESPDADDDAEHDPLEPPGRADVGDDDDLTLGDLRAMVRRAKKRKAKSTKPEDVQRYQVLCAVLDGAPLAMPGHRSTTVNQVVSMITHYIPPDTAWELVQELLRPAVAAMPCDAANPCRPGCVGDCVEHWLNVAEQSYDRAMPRAKQHAADMAARKQANLDAQAALLGLAPNVRLAPEVSAVVEGQLDMNPGTAMVPYVAPANDAPPPPSPADVTPTKPPIQTLTQVVTQALRAREGGVVNDWTDLVIKSADGKLMPCGFNVYLILSHHPVHKGTIRFNEVSRDIEVTGGPFHGVSADVYATYLTGWLHRVGGLKMKQHEVEEQILAVAHENRFDPVKDYLERVEKLWDGVPRLDDFFFSIVKVKTVNDKGVDISAHLRRIGAKVWISSVARIFAPGCQVDTMLVLEGLEGEGKTSLLRRMFGDYFITLRMSTDSKDAQMIPGENWGAEVAELHAVRKSDDASLLSYLTETVDKYRPPYGRRFIKVPRRNISIGTTNEKKWLTPGKGRRRYWPVYVESIDLDAIALVGRDGKIIPGTGLRDQLWAEAVVRYKAGERWWLTKEERAEADAEAETRVEASYFQEKIGTWYYAHGTTKRQELVPTMVQIADDVLKIASERMTSQLMVQIDRAMLNLGFTKQQQDVGGRKMDVFMPSREMRGLPPIPSYLRPVPNPPTTPEEGFDAILNSTPTGGKKEE